MTTWHYVIRDNRGSWERGPTPAPDARALEVIAAREAEADYCGLVGDSVLRDLRTVLAEVERPRALKEPGT